MALTSERLRLQRLSRPGGAQPGAPAGASCGTRVHRCANVLHYQGIRRSSSTQSFVALRPATLLVSVQMVSCQPQRGSSVALTKFP